MPTQTKSKLPLLGIGLLALLALVVAFTKPTTSDVQSMIQTQSATFGAVSNTNAPAANTVLPDGYLTPNPTVYDYLIARGFLYTDKALGFGNTSGIPIYQQSSRVAITPNAGIVCSLVNPFTTATSTYEFSINLSSTSASTAQLILGTGVAATATTTSQSVFTATASVPLTYDTSGTTTSGTFGLIGPGASLNVGGVLGTAQATLNQMGGTCGAIFTTTN